MKGDGAETVAITSPIRAIGGCQRKICWQLSINNEAPMIPGRNETRGSRLSIVQQAAGLRDQLKPVLGHLNAAMTEWRLGEHRSP